MVAEIKWIKITTNMFDDEKIKLIDAMPERDTIHYIWIRLLVQSGKTNANGYIFLNENVPYTEEMLSTIFNRPLNSVRLALQTLSNFGMIHVQEDRLIKISNWEKHQNIEGMEKIREQNRLRKQKQRANEKLLKKENCTETENELSRDGHNNHVTDTQQNKNKNKNKKEELDIDNNSSSSSSSSSSLSTTNDRTFNKFAIIAIKLEQCGFKDVSKSMVTNLQKDLEIYGEEFVLDAIEEADSRNIHNYKYIKGILDNWKQNEKLKKNELPIDVDYKENNNAIFRNEINEETKLKIIKAIGELKYTTWILSSELIEQKDKLLIKVQNSLSRDALFKLVPEITEVLNKEIEIQVV